MGGGSRGKKKPKLRDYSIRATDEEIAALRNSFASHNDPLTCAILGAVLVEHELDSLLRRKFTRKDDETWEELVSERGPLSSFSTKITAANAFKLFNEKTHHDLNIIREIRNAFAHARKLLNFNDPLVVSKLVSSKLLSKTAKKGLTTAISARQTYVILCFEVTLKLLSWRARAQTAANRRILKKLETSPIAKALFAGINPDLRSLKERQAMTSLLPLDSQSADPRPPSRGLGLLGLLDLIPKSDDKTGK